MSPVLGVTRRAHRGTAATLAGAALVLALSGCGGGESAAPAPTPAPAASSAAPAPAAPAPGAPAAPTTDKVSANTASEEELGQRFEQAGIPNAERWADEVVEYRPYPADDPNFTSLRAELAKYNPGPGVVDQIVAVLQP
jgi:DNA uptake protein ComE-like DNA-binding protein